MAPPVAPKTCCSGARDPDPRRRPTTKCPIGGGGRTKSCLRLEARESIHCLGYLGRRRMNAVGGDLDPVGRERRQVRKEDTPARSGTPRYCPLCPLRLSRYPTHDFFRELIQNAHISVFRTAADLRAPPYTFPAVGDTRLARPIYTEFRGPWVLTAVCARLTIRNTSLADVRARFRRWWLWCSTETVS